MPRQTAVERRVEVLENIALAMEHRMSRLERIGWAVVGLLAGYGVVDIGKILGLLGG